MVAWLFPVRVAARKDNVSSDIPAHRPALITPPSSSGVFKLPEATDITADCRNGCVDSGAIRKMISPFQLNLTETDQIMKGGR